MQLRFVVLFLRVFYFFFFFCVLFFLPMSAFLRQAEESGAVVCVSVGVGVGGKGGGSVVGL